MFSIIRDFFLQFLNPLAFVGVVLFVSLFLIKETKYCHLVCCDLFVGHQHFW